MNEKSVVIDKNEKRVLNDNENENESEIEVEQGSDDDEVRIKNNHFLPFSLYV